MTHAPSAAWNTGQDAPAVSLILRLMWKPLIVGSGKSGTLCLRMQDEHSSAVAAKLETLWPILLRGASILRCGTPC